MHVTSYGWADKALRDGVMKLVHEQEINAIELDLKDEAGEIGFDPQCRSAARSARSRHVYDLDKTSDSCTRGASA